eukprot:TRINITY_DN5108_c0_g1_i1.p1 TRINITY_DN5108_c0_g1~~TRINITY_DN5108_c0_g1_i1.p1  ORF type:complete len:396 (+),score=92.99 TRINITY_DN5108_c0_g1_i1:130-1317(+)
MQHLNMALPLKVFVALAPAAFVDAAQVGRQLPIIPAPDNGAAFLVPKDLSRLPDELSDQRNPNSIISRLSGAASGGDEQASAHACDMGTRAPKNDCLSVEGRGCMWVELDNHDPSPFAVKSSAYCMPCEIDNEAIPCWTPGAWIGSEQVKSCQMSCRHQTRVVQPQYVCSDFVGVDSITSCFNRGQKSGSKCMFMTYKDKEDKMRSSCAPCEVDGVGKINCPDIGGKGPEEKSSVQTCESQCEAPRPEVQAGLVILAPIGFPASPGLSVVDGPADEMVSAPNAPPAPSAEQELALKSSAEAMAGFIPPPVFPPPPPKYFPVVVYRSPKDETADDLNPLPARMDWPVKLPEGQEPEKPSAEKPGLPEAPEPETKLVQESSTIGAAVEPRALGRLMR